MANDIDVRIPTVDERPDAEIARDAGAAIKSRLATTWQRIKVIVKNGYVNLEGEVEWQYQRETAGAAVRWLRVKGVTNFIEVKPRAEPDEVKRRIEEAFKRNAEIDARRIVVETNGGEVILKGKVRSWAEREEAERVAWTAPGVTKVDDRIVVFYRMLELPSGIDPSAVQATMAKGVLKITIPKPVHTETKKIEVKDGVWTGRLGRAGASGPLPPIRSAFPLRAKPACRAKA